MPTIVQSLVVYFSIYYSVFSDPYPPAKAANLSAGIHTSFTAIYIVTQLMYHYLLQLLAPRQICLAVIVAVIIIIILSTTTNTWCSFGLVDSLSPPLNCE